MTVLAPAERLPETFWKIFAKPYAKPVPRTDLCATPRFDPCAEVRPVRRGSTRAPGRAERRAKPA
jgi:hypothetical protein